MAASNIFTLRPFLYNTKNVIIYVVLHNLEFVFTEPFYTSWSLFSLEILTDAGKKSTYTDTYSNVIQLNRLLLQNGIILLSRQ